MPKFTNKNPLKMAMSNIGKLTGKILQKLRGMTAGQIHAVQVQTLNGKSKKEKIEFEMSNSMVFYDPSILIYWPDNQIKSDIRVRKDAEDTKLGTTKYEWTYYQTGEVDIITTTELDANDLVISTKQLKHYTDGRQPEII